MILLRAQEIDLQIVDYAFGGRGIARIETEKGPNVRPSQRPNYSKYFNVHQSKPFLNFKRSRVAPIFTYLLPYKSSIKKRVRFLLLPDSAVSRTALTNLIALYPLQLIIITAIKWNIAFRV